MIGQMCDEFLDKEVLPHIQAIDNQEEGLMPSLLDKAGALGLLGAAFPEQYGGLGKDFVTATLINERLGGGHSFAVAMAAAAGRVYRTGKRQPALPAVGQRRQGAPGLSRLW